MSGAKEEAISIRVPFAKAADEQRIVYGWASVTKVNGKPYIDLQGDIIETEELRKAVYEFMAGPRASGVMHMTDDAGQIRKTGTVVDSLIVTEDLAKALGMPADKEGWLIGVKVDDPDVWRMVKAGMLTGFSIGGVGVREPA